MIKAPLTKNSPWLLDHQVPEDAKIILDEIFKQPLPPFASARTTNSRKAILNTLRDRGIRFVKIWSGNNIGFLKDLHYVVKIQMDEFSLPYDLNHNLRRIVMNDAIRDCIIEKDLKHITYIKKSLYPLPSVELGDEINDTNSIVVAQKINYLEVNIDELTDEEYEDLLTVTAHVKYADLRSPNLTWIEENGLRKIAFLDTEDIAIKWTVNGVSAFYQWKGEGKKIRDIVEIAKGLLENHQPERARRIIQLLFAYCRGISALSPEDNQIRRKELFAKVTSTVEKELQDIVDQANISFTISPIRSEDDIQHLKAVNAKLRNMQDFL